MRVAALHGLQLTSSGSELTARVPRHSSCTITLADQNVVARVCVRARQTIHIEPRSCLGVAPVQKLRRAVRDLVKLGVARWQTLWQWRRAGGVRGRVLVVLGQCYFLH
jgi:hypothetical protein